MAKVVAKAKQSPAMLDRRRVPVWVPGVALLVLVVGLGVAGVFIARQDAEVASGGGMGKDDLKKLVGRWQRVGEDYVIEIKSVGSDGKLEAGYFNPNPIHVAKAEASVKDGMIGVMVEMQDQGYPGSYYTLTYHGGADRLRGMYHQLGAGEEFPVEFERMR